MGRLLLVALLATACATVSPERREAQCRYARESTEIVVRQTSATTFTAYDRPRGGLAGQAAADSVCDDYTGASASE